LVTLGSIADAATIGPGTVNAHVRSTAVSTAAAAASLAGTLTIAGAVSVSNFPATQPVSGTVTANQGGAPWSIQGFQANGSAVTENPVLIAGQSAGNIKLLGLDVNGGVTQGQPNALGTQSWGVQGAAANGAAVAGNPVLMGGWDGANAHIFTVAGGQSDNVSGNSVLQTNLIVFNGSTYDRVYNNRDVILLASAARTTTQTSADITTFNCIALAVYLNITVNAAGSITLSVNEKDPASGVYNPILTGLALAAVTGMTVYRIDPRTPAVANSIAQIAMPRIFQIVVTANLAANVTYSVGYTLKVG
jgi:hypothetical protein